MKKTLIEPADVTQKVRSVLVQGTTGYQAQSPEQSCTPNGGR